MSRVKCERCPYQYFDYDDEGNTTSSDEYCHWQSRCPGDVPPCEEYGYEEYVEDIPEYEEDWDE